MEKRGEASHAVILILFLVAFIILFLVMRQVLQIG